MSAALAALLLVGLSLGCDRESSATGTGAAESAPVIAASAAEAATVPAAPRPDRPLPHGASCITAECHATFTTASYIHGPVASGDCDTCHLGDFGGHVYPLKRDAQETCTFCHAVSGTAPHQHAALEQGCTACHDPHISRTKFLLNADSVADVCQNCHDVPLKGFAHNPYLKGECSLCHQPHQSPNAFLLRGGEGPRHCSMCHEPMLQAIASGSHAHEPAIDGCTTCHNPHTSDNPHQLHLPVEQTCTSCHEDVKQQVGQRTISHGAIRSKEQCANCHSPHAAGQPQLLRQRMDKLCLQCHDKPQRSPDGRIIANMSPVLEQSEFLHGPIRFGDCSTCHEPHGGDRRLLLGWNFPVSFYTGFELDKYALCFRCHEPELVLNPAAPHLTRFRDGEVNLHYLHVNRDVKGRTCKACHAVHGSNLPSHVAEQVPFEGSSWIMPIEYHQTEEGGSCAPGCHFPRTYSRVRDTSRADGGGVP